MKSRILFSAILACSVLGLGKSASADDPLLGSIKMFAGNFAPRGYAFCDGRLLPIAQNTALFSLLGTTYGGDGRTTFALPDLRGRAPVHAGRGPGLSDQKLGGKGGNENTTLDSSAIRVETVTVVAVEEDADADKEATKKKNREDLGLKTTEVTRDTLTGRAFSNKPPSLGINFIIATQGIFPSRN